MIRCSASEFGFFAFAFVACTVKPVDVSTLPPNESVSALTVSESQQYCREAHKYLQATYSDDDAKRAVCYFSASFATWDATSDADAQNRCRSKFNDCMEQPGTVIEQDPTVTCAQSDASRFWSCKATVAQKNECIRDTIARDLARYRSDLCVLANKAGGSADTLAEVPSCQALEAQCPSPSSY